MPMRTVRKRKGWRRERTNTRAHTKSIHEMPQNIEKLRSAATWPHQGSGKGKDGYIAPFAAWRSQSFGASLIRRIGGVAFHVYRVEKALVTTRLRASSFFLRSSAVESSTSSWAMA